MAKPRTLRRAPRKPRAPRARIRMYRQGLGDCFLVTLGVADRPYRILIDCGVIQGTLNAAKALDQVAQDILKETGGHVDLLVATHEHYDHVAGFALAEDTFRKLTYGEVWMGWTEDPDDPVARELGGERDDALAALRLGVAQLKFAGAAASAAPAEELLSFFGVGPDLAADPARPGVTKQAFEVVRSLTAKPRYVRPTDPPKALPDGSRLFPLGPPLDLKLLRKVLPGKGQGYGLVGLDALAMDEGADKAGAPGSPFGPTYAIPLQLAEQSPFFRERYRDPKEARRALDDLGADALTQLALKLDSATNNTSLALALELPGGDVLLFAADAQIGSWLTWGGLKWQTPAGEVTGEQLLRRTLVYKVGHHGSHNATLKPMGLEIMDSLAYALLPVNEEMARKKGWGRMPLPDIVTELSTRAKARVVRIDQPKPAAFGPELVETPLYYELTV